LLVFDTSAFINGWVDHYPPGTFPSVWALVGECMADGRIIAPHAVLVELERKDDEVYEWAREHAAAFVDPSSDVQERAGEIYGDLPNPGDRDAADPFVVAEASVRGFSVVTYEGRTYSGVPTRNWHRTMPGICRRYGLPCLTLPEALTHLGGHF
jgi:hypothetical protein